MYRDDPVRIQGICIKRGDWNEIYPQMQAFYLYDMKMEYKLLLSHLTLSVLAILLLTTLLYTNSAGILEHKLLNSAEATSEKSFCPWKISSRNTIT